MSLKENLYTVQDPYGLLAPRPEQIIDTDLRDIKAQLRRAEDPRTKPWDARAQIGQHRIALKAIGEAAVAEQEMAEWARRALYPQPLIETQTKRITSNVNTDNSGQRFEARAVKPPAENETGIGIGLGVGTLAVCAGLWGAAGKLQKEHPKLAATLRLITVGLLVSGEVAAGTTVFTGCSPESPPVAEATAAAPEEEPETPTAEAASGEPTRGPSEAESQAAPTATPEVTRPTGAGGEYPVELINRIESGDFAEQEEMLEKWVEIAWGPMGIFHQDSEIHFKYVQDRRAVDEDGQPKVMVALESGDYSGQIISRPLDLRADGQRGRQTFQEMPTSPDPEAGVDKSPLFLNVTGPIENTDIPASSLLAFHNGEWVRVDESGQVVARVNPETGQWEEVKEIEEETGEIEIVLSEEGRKVAEAFLNGEIPEEGELFTDPIGRPLEIGYKKIGNLLNVNPEDELSGKRQVNSIQALIVDVLKVKIEEDKEMGILIIGIEAEGGRIILPIIGGREDLPTLDSLYIWETSQQTFNDTGSVRPDYLPLDEAIRILEKYRGKPVRIHFEQLDYSESLPSIDATEQEIADTKKGLWLHIPNNQLLFANPETLAGKIGIDLEAGEVGIRVKTEDLPFSWGVFKLCTENIEP